MCIWIYLLQEFGSKSKCNTVILIIFSYASCLLWEKKPKKPTSWFDVRWVFFFFFSFQFFFPPTLRHWVRLDKNLVGMWVVVFFCPPAQDLCLMTFMNVIRFSRCFALVLLLNDNMHLQQRSEFSPKFCFMSSIHQSGALIRLLYCGWQVPVWKMC